MKKPKFKMDLAGKLLRVDRAAREMRNAIRSLMKDMPSGYVWKAPEDERCRIIDDPPAPDPIKHPAMRVPLMGNEIPSLTESQARNYDPRKISVTIGGKEIKGFTKNPRIRFTMDPDPNEERPVDVRIGNYWMKGTTSKALGLKLDVPIRIRHDGKAKISQIRKNLECALLTAEREGLLDRGAAKRAASRAKFTVVSSDTIVLSLNGTKGSRPSSKTARNLKCPIRTSKKVNR